MPKAKLIKSGGDQIVCLPKEFELKGDSVNIKRVGNGVLLLPEEFSWEEMFASLDLSPDFMEDGRDQGEQEREVLCLKRN